jgi:heme-degrading monooxygenase HmoA
MSVVTIYHFTAKPGLRDQVISAMEIVKGAAGLEAMQLFIDQSHPDKLVSVEAWRTLDDHDQFIAGFTPEQQAGFESMFLEAPKVVAYSQAS